MNKEQIMESISNIELSKLKPFEDHPFSIRDDEAMQQTVESVREYGVLVPAIARPLEDGHRVDLRSSKKTRLRAQAYHNAGHRAECRSKHCNYHHGGQ